MSHDYTRKKIKEGEHKIQLSLVFSRFLVLHYILNSLCIRTKNKMISLWILCSLTKRAVKTVLRSIIIYYYKKFLFISIETFFLELFVWLWHYPLIPKRAFYNVVVYTLKSSVNFTINFNVCRALFVFVLCCFHQTNRLVSEIFNLWGRN